MKKKRVFLFSWFAACLVCPAVSSAQTANDFAEIFVYPRDRNYLPGYAPSLPEVTYEGTFADDRGVVTRWEFKTDKRVISRELWTDEDGETNGRIRLGRRF